MPLAGLSGGSYHLTTSHSGTVIELIARAAGLAQASLFVDRRKESRVLQQLQYFDFAHAPKPLAQNAGWLLLSWCKGSHPSHQQFMSPLFQSALAAVIAKLHNQPLLRYRLQLKAEIAHYGRLVDHRRQSPKWLKWHRHFMTTKMPTTLKLAPAHMDIHRGNVLNGDGQRIMLLDWEYAANADIGLSLETYFQANQLTETQRQFFLSEYCERYQAYCELPRLSQQCRLWTPWVKYMMLMWYEVQWNQSQNKDFLLHSQSLRQYFHLLN